MKKKKALPPQDHVPHLRFFGLPRLVPYLRPYRRLFWLMLVFDVLFGAIDTVIPLFQSWAINHYILPGELVRLGLFVALYVVVLLVQLLVSYLGFLYSAEIEMYIGRDLRRHAFDHLQTLSFSYYNQNSVGYIHARVMSDTFRIGQVVSWTMMDGLCNLAYLIASTVIMFTINPLLALVVLAILPVAAVLSFFFERKLVAANRLVRETNSRLTGDINEGITGANTAKTLVVEDRLREHFDADATAMRRVTLRQTRYRSLFGSLITFTASVTLALVLWRGGLLSARGVMTIGTLAVFMSYAQNMMEPVRWMVTALSDLINTRVNIERFTGLVDTTSDVTDTPAVIEKYGDAFTPKKENWEPLVGDVEFCDVTFHYPDGDKNVLEHFSLTVPAGTNVAIVGETGAGKSTLVNLVCRFFEPTEGQVLIDGRDARERSQLWLHSHIGYVLQTPHLFSGTIRENLLYGNPDATDEQIDAAVRAVCADEIIDRMEKGYDSDVGEGGDMLSAGEKQLISFARALLADPRIFILDEATSSVDTVTEARLQRATEHMMRGRTSFVIAHRLSTIRNADVILLVQDGRIVERGTHDELMAARGAYYDLYTRQFEEEMLDRAFSAEKE
ncbi:MAG: ABC transporter ATP-binding protein [Clostridia bacterium]|nr:ABC transporter ATP-binding protein [Clostridia bacterium]